MACVLCNRWCPSHTFVGGSILAEPRDESRCDQVACEACGVVQCHGNGTRQGTCKHCHYGRLPGWSHRKATCDYKGCSERAVYAYLPASKKNACKAHGDAVLQRQARRRHARQAERDRFFEAVAAREARTRHEQELARGRRPVENTDTCEYGDGYTSDIECDSDPSGGNLIDRVREERDQSCDPEAAEVAMMHDSDLL